MKDTGHLASIPPRVKLLVVEREPLADEMSKNLFLEYQALFMSMHNQCTYDINRVDAQKIKRKEKLLS